MQAIAIPADKELWDDTDAERFVTETTSRLTHAEHARWEAILIDNEGFDGEPVLQARALAKMLRPMRETSATNPALRVDAIFTQFEDAAEAEMREMLADAHDWTVETGMYRVDGTVYKVLPVRDESHFYAKRLGDDGFEYARGAMRVIRPEHRMTLAEAKAYGRLTGRCCVCAKLLTDPESIEAGIGPVCAKRV